MYFYGKLFCSRANPDKLFEVFVEVGRPEKEGEGTELQIITFTDYRSLQNAHIYKSELT